MFVLTVAGLASANGEPTLSLFSLVLAKAESVKHMHVMSWITRSLWNIMRKFENEAWNSKLRINAPIE